MATFFIKNNQIAENKIKILDDDFHHIKNVLRMKQGEEIKICDEIGTRYKAKLSTYENDSALFDIIEKIDESSELSVKIDLYQGLPKSDKLELIIQKCTELGVNSVIPTVMEHSIAKVDEKSIKNKLERWNKIAKEASEQSNRQKIPQVPEVNIFKNIVEKLEKYDIVLLPYENERSVSIKEALNKAKTIKKLEKIAVLIGPEGGFSQSEVDVISSLPNSYVVTLGNRILRTETAAIASIAMISYEFDLK